MGIRMKCSRTFVALAALLTSACGASAPGVEGAPQPARRPSVSTDEVYGHKDGLALTFDVYRAAPRNSNSLPPRALGAVLHPLHGDHMPHGKICDLELPAKTGEASAEFYGSIFGWKVRRRGDGEIAFDDHRR